MEVSVPLARNSIIAAIGTRCLQIFGPVKYKLYSICFGFATITFQKKTTNFVQRLLYIEKISIFFMVFSTPVNVELATRLPREEEHS